jgi:hypothetical protein
MLTITEGEIAVRLARTAIKECLENGRKIQPENLPDVFIEKRGVFVTLNKKKERASGLHRKTLSSFTPWGSDHTFSDQCGARRSAIPPSRTR